MADLHCLAIVSAAQYSWPGWIDFNERVEIAWSALALHLETCQRMPYSPTLISVAQEAIRGYTYTTSRFWPNMLTVDHEERLIERLTVAMIWHKLRPRHRSVFVALAVYEDYARAAEALGITVITFQKAISDARRTFLRFWHEGEKPSRIHVRHKFIKSQPITR